MNRVNAELGATRRLACAVAPLLLTTFACTASIVGTEPGQGTGAASGAAGSSAQSGVGGASGSSGKSAGGASGKSTGGASGASGSSAGTAGSAPIEGGRPVSMEGEPIYSRFLRLTNDQWEHSVRDILRLTAPTGVSEDFTHAVGGTTDFDNNERVVFVDNAAWADFRLGAEAMADRVTATDAELQKVVTGTDPATFIKIFGRRAFRRDLTPAEVTSYEGIYTTGSLSTQGTQSAFTKGARYVITAMLQSPHFLYRIEMGDAGAPLAGYEMAAKLSLWIRDTTPTDAMLDAAVARGFDTPEGAAAQAEQMLEEPAALDSMRKFHGELYKLALYDSIAKTGVTGYTTALNAELKEASVLFFDRLYSGGFGIAEMLTTTTAFVGPGLAPLYGVKISGTGIQEVDVAGRAGYYAQVPFLALWSRNNVPDSIHRGVRINLDTLCADPGLPNLDLPPIPAAAADQSNRDVITALTMTCGRECHGEIINPIGFAFESFDGLGRTRTKDNGKDVVTSGAYPFAEGKQEFADSAELMAIVASGSQAHQCWAKKMTSYALSRDLVESDRPMVEALGEVSRAPGTSLKQVMVALVKNDGFRTHVGGAQ